MEDVAGGGLEAGDDDAGGLGTGGGVAQLLMFLRDRTQGTSLSKEHRAESTQ